MTAPSIPRPFSEGTVDVAAAAAVAMATATAAAAAAEDEPEADRGGRTVGPIIVH